MMVISFNTAQYKAGALTRRDGIQDQGIQHRIGPGKCVNQAAENIRVTR